MQIAILLQEWSEWSAQATATELGLTVLSGLIDARWATEGDNEMAVQVIDLMARIERGDRNA
jgi:hypothetical protein